MEKYCKKLSTKHSSYPAPFSQCDKTWPECKTVLTTENTNVNSPLGHCHAYVQVCHPFPGGGGVLIIIFLKGLRSQKSISQISTDPPTHLPTNKPLNDNLLSVTGAQWGALTE